MESLTIGDWLAILASLVLGWAVILLLMWAVRRWVPFVVPVAWTYLVLSGVAGTYGLYVAVDSSVRVASALAPLWALLAMFLLSAVIWPYLLMWALVSRY